MVDYKPRPGESPGEHRSRVQREMADEKAGVGAGESADAKVEAAKAKVHADNEARAKARMANPNHATNKLDNAVEEAEVEQRHKEIRRHGDVKSVDKKAADAAYNADVEFKGKSADEQAAVARAKPAKGIPAPAPAAPVPAARPAMRVSPEVGAKARREPSPAPSPAVNAQNNMGNIRGGDRGGVLAGTTANDSPGELARARAAATKGSRGTSNRQAEAQAARASSSRSAASAAPARTAPVAPQPQGVFAGSRMAQAHAAVLGFSGPSSKMSDKPGPTRFAAQPPAPAERQPARGQVLSPASNPAPAAPAPVAPNSGGTAADRFVARSGMDQIRAAGKGDNLPSTRKTIGAAAPKMGSEITYGVANPASPTAKTRAKYNTHITGGGTTESYWADRDAKKGTGPAKKSPPVASVEPLAATPGPITPPVASRPPAPSMPPRPAAVPQTTPLSPQMSRPATAPVAPAKPSPAASRPVAPSAPPAGPSRPAPAPVAPSGPTGPVTPVTSAPAPSGGGRSGLAAPRSPEVGGGRGGIHQGGEHNVNTVGNNNYTHVGDVSHHTTVNNYGTMTGNSVGNASSGGYGGHGSGGGSRVPSGNTPQQHARHQPHFNLWVKDVNGTHDLQKNINHLTGKTDGSGHRVAPQKRQAGGNQQPLAGSQRASGGAAPAAATGTGTTHNWTGPAHQSPTSASGNGTANGTP